MQEKHEAVMKEHGEWLLGLRLIDRSEVVLIIAGPVCAILAGASASQMVGRIEGLCSLLGLLSMMLAAAVLVRRHLNFVPLGLATLAAANLTLAIFTDWPGLNAICYGLGILGAPCWLLAIWGVLRIDQRWGQVAEYTVRDDFKWLVTRSPLPLRWRLLALLNKTKHNH